MKIIDYNSFIEKMNETKINNYDCTILLFFTEEIMLGEEDTEIKDEENFYNTFSDLIYYIETKGCDLNEKDNFKSIIDDLIAISSEKKLDKIDVNYVLFKEKILKFIDKFKNEKITENILKEQLCKLFELMDYDYLLKELTFRFNASQK